MHAVSAGAKRNVKPYGAAGVGGAAQQLGCEVGRLGWWMAADGSPWFARCCVRRVCAQVLCARHRAAVDDSSWSKVSRVRAVTVLSGLFSMDVISA